MVIIFEGGSYQKGSNMRIVLVKENVSTSMMMMMMRRRRTNCLKHITNIVHVAIAIQPEPSAIPRKGKMLCATAPRWLLLASVL